jgi:hypothetical protein
MKMHKFEMHIIDFPDYGPEEYKSMLESLRIIGNVFHAGTADIGEWEDKHLLNTTKDADVWNSYYDTRS